jgi:hypothetical protein
VSSVSSWSDAPGRSTVELTDLADKLAGFQAAYAGSTAGVAITALILSNKRIDRVELALDRLGAKFDTKFESLDARLEMLTGSIHDLDKRLALLEES